jgi:hypothetical protein
MYEIGMWHIHRLAIGHVNAKWKEAGRFKTPADLLAGHGTKIPDLQVGGNIIEKIEAELSQLAN